MTPTIYHVSRNTLTVFSARRQRADGHAYDMHSGPTTHVYSRIMLVHKRSQEVSFETEYYLSCLRPKVSSRSSCVSPESRPTTLPISRLSDINRLNLLIAALYFSYLRKPWKSQLYQQSLSPGRTQIRSHCSKLNPQPPPQPPNPLGQKTTEEYTGP